MGLTAEDFVNHNDSFSNVVFVVEDGFVTVEKRVLTLTSASDEKLYDSYPLRNDKVTVSGDGFAEGEGAVYDVTGVQRDPGDSKNTFDYLLNDGTKAENYEITKVEGTLKITAPDSLYYSIEYYYNGIINPSMTRTVSGVKLGDVIENVDAASITEGELSGSYKFIEAVGLPLTIGVETSEKCSASTMRAARLHMIPMRRSRSFTNIIRMGVSPVNRRDRSTVPKLVSRSISTTETCRQIRSSAPLRFMGGGVMTLTVAESGWREPRSPMRSSSMATDLLQIPHRFRSITNPTSQFRRMAQPT